MEDTLRGNKKKFGSKIQKTVLILVLMEDTLRDKKKFGSKIQKTVLILVLMEDTLRDFRCLC